MISDRSLDDRLTNEEIKFKIISRIKSNHKSYGHKMLVVFFDSEEERKEMEDLLNEVEIN